MYNISAIPLSYVGLTNSYVDENNITRLYDIISIICGTGELLCHSYEILRGGTYGHDEAKTWYYYVYITSPPQVID